MLKRPIVVLDTETTGFPGNDWARVIEIGAVLLDTDGAEAATFSMLIRPDVLDDRADKALEINHITRADLYARGEVAEDVVRALSSWLAVNDLPGYAYATAFNVGFDRPMLARTGWEHPRWASCIMERASDIMGAAGLLEPNRYGGGYRWPKLSAAAEHFGVEVIGEPHRALTDARTAAGILRAIVSSTL